MATTELSLENLKQHVGRRATSTDVVTAGPANQLRLAFARPEPEFRDGDPLPPGWQILYFLPRFGPHELRPDGSPLDSGVVPPMPLPRRMFAGERLRFLQPIRIGDTLRRETELADLSLKTGGTRTLGFATTAPPLTRSRSRPRSHGSSSVNIVTHCRYEHGMRVMSVPQNERSGPNASKICFR